MRTATSNEGSSDNADWEAAKNAELRSSIRRQAGDGDANLGDVWPTITRVGPRAGRAICAIEWRETLAGEATLRRVRVAPPEHEIHAGVDSVVTKNLADNRVALPGDTRAAPPGGRVGSTTWSAGSTAGAGPSYRSCTASPQRRRCVLSFVYCQSTTTEVCVTV